MSVWSVDNLHRLGELVPGHYVLLRDGHQVAEGLDKPELKKIAAMLNLITEKQETAVILGRSAA